MKTINLNGKMYELKEIKQNVKKAVKVKNTIEQQRLKSLKWFKDTLKVDVVESGLKVSLPTKSGLKVYDGVRFSNGRVAVFLSSGFLRYSWA